MLYVMLCDTWIDTLLAHCAIDIHTLWVVKLAFGWTAGMICSSYRTLLNVYVHIPSFSHL